MKGGAVFKYLAYGLLFAGLGQTVWAADKIETETGKDFARIIFELEPASKMESTLDGGVVTLRFGRKLDLDVAQLATRLPLYIAAVRADADQQSLRLALHQSVRLQSSYEGNRVALDLVQVAARKGPAPLAAKTPLVQTFSVAQLPVLKVRSGIYADHTRLVFDWPQETKYSVAAEKDRVIMRFDGAAQPDFSAVERMSPPWLKRTGWRMDKNQLVVELGIDPGSSHRHSRSEHKIVLDILAPKSDAQAISEKLAGVEGASAAQIQQIAQAAQILNPKAPKSKAESKAEPETPVDPIKPAEQKSEAAAQAQRLGAGAVLHLPKAGARNMAAFMRGVTAWLVLEGSVAIDPVALKAQLGDLPTMVDVSRDHDITILRIGLKQPERIAVQAVGDDLKFFIAPERQAAMLGIGFARDTGAKGDWALVTILPGAQRALLLDDPKVGDKIFVMPGRAGRAVLEDRHYADFHLLPTAAGVALIPLRDAIAVEAKAARIRISRIGGLALTPPAATSDSEALLAAAGDMRTFLDFAKWPQAEGEAFLQMERQLRLSVAKAAPERRNRARLQLAQFYLANHFAAEALGVLQQMRASDPALDGHQQLQMMRAAADFMMGRYRQTHLDLVGAHFSGDRHAALWRGLADAALENWREARLALIDAGPVLKIYAPEWQGRAILAMANAALARGSVENADLALKRLPKDLPAPLLLQSRLTRARLMAQEDRYGAAKPLFEALEQSLDPQLAAQAIFENTNAAINAGAISSAKAIDILEGLRFRWRGDALEMKTLRKLSALYFKGQNWREGLERLRIAAQYFPQDELARAAHDDMRKAFDKLYLQAAADKLAPVEALSLFYDFIDLTPIGPKGDEMIRHMADRLVKVDLLGPAATLIQYQVDKRLEGVARAQVATRLATLYLLDQKPEQALEALHKTAISGLPDHVISQRMLLQARALAALKRYDQALDLVADHASPEARALEADISWDSRNWPDAARRLNGLLGQRWTQAEALSGKERRDVMRAAIAYSLANDEAGLELLRQNYAPKLKDTPDASSFAVVTQPIDRQGMAFRETAAKLASITTLEAFMKDFKADQTL